MLSRLTSCVIRDDVLITSLIGDRHLVVLMLASPRRYKDTVRCKSHGCVVNTELL